MPTNYQRGRTFEYRTRDALLRRGAVFVMRAAQSKGAADLAAFWPLEVNKATTGGWRTRKHPWLVQCKYSIHGGGTVSPAERVKLAALAKECGGVGVIATPGKDGKGVIFRGVDSAGKMRVLD